MFLSLARELRSLDDRLRKIASLARRAGGRLRSLGRAGREHLTI
jgi:hypothetical protein